MKNRTLNTALAKLTVNYSWPIIITSILGLILIGFQLKDLKIDNTMMSFLPEESTTIQDYKSLHQIFGSDEHIIIGVESSDPFSKGFVDFLANIQKSLENEVPYVKSVESYLSARRVSHSDGELLVDTLLESYPLNEQQLNTLKDDVLSNETYRNVYINRAGDFVAIHIKPLSTSSAKGSMVLDSKQKEGIYNAIQRILTQYKNSDKQFYLNGSPIIQYETTKGYALEAGIYYGLCYLIIMVLLFALFKRVSGIILPLVVAQLSVVVCLSVFAMGSINLTSVAQILPAFILVAGIGDSIHILTVFYQNLDKGLNKVSAIRHTVEHSGPPVLLTSLTTAGGLIAFTLSGLQPVSSFGWAAAIGVMAAFFFSVILLPAILNVTPIKINITTRKSSEYKKYSFRQHVSKFISKLGQLGLDHNKLVIVASIIIAIGAIDGISKLRFSFDLIDYFDESYPFRQSSEHINEKLQGINSLEFIIQAKNGDDFKNPASLVAIDNISNRLKTTSIDGLTAAQAISLATVVKEINQAMNDGSIQHREIPESREAIAQYLLLFEMSGAEDLEELVTVDYSTLRLSVLLPIVDSSKYLSYIETVTALLEDELGDDFNVTATGMAKLQGSIFIGIVDSTLESYVIAIAILSLLMFLFAGDIKLGLISMIPNLLPVYLVIASMGWLDIPIELGSVILGSVVLGLAVDDTIHFIYNFKRYFKEHGDYEKAVQQTLATAGNAMMFTSLLIFCGYSVFLLSNLNAIQNFGLMNMNAAVIALVADIILAPALIATFYHTKANRKEVMELA